MKPAIPRLVHLIWGLTALPALAMDNTLAGPGFTGLGVTPNAHLLGWGRTEAGYENQVSGVPRNTSGHNYTLGFGLFPNLEISGRLATNTLEVNCFTGNCGARDLSASGKVGIGLDAAGRFRIAAGVTDVGGAVTYFRTAYGVLTFDQGPFQASAGLARRAAGGINGSRSPLDGPFGSLAWQPLPLVRGHLEYADGKGWAGVQLFAPAGWLPEGWALSAGANMRLNDSPLTQRSWMTANLSIPLYKVPALPGTRKASLPELQAGEQRLPAYEARIAAPTQPAAATPAAPPPTALASPPPKPPAPAPATDDTLRALANHLQAKGLEDIWVGRMADGTVAVRANNGTYQWNALDALGAALGAVARTLGDHRAGYRLVLTQRQVPIVGVTGQADCLREWIDLPANSCTAGQLSTPGTMPLEPLHAGASWVVRRQKPAWQTVRVTVSPVLRTRVGTEFGALDYDLGANVEAQLPLWSGASVEWAVNVPVARTNDFEANQIFGNDRIRSTTDRLTFTQSMRVPLERWIPVADSRRYGSGALTAQAVVGRIGTFYDGALGSLRWEPGEGRHRLGAEAGLFRNNSFQGGIGPLGNLRRGAPVLGSYRYSFMPTRTDLEATAGRFINNDTGFRLGLRQWFADTAVELYYRRTSAPSQRAIQSAGIAVSLPLGPRQAWQPVPHLQLAGSPRFLHRVETTIREPGGGNPISVGQGVRPPVPGLDATFNSDRASLAYFEDNLRRIRDAAR